MMRYVFQHKDEFDNIIIFEVFAPRHVRGAWKAQIIYDGYDLGTIFLCDIAEMDWYTILYNLHGVNARGCVIHGVATFDIEMVKDDENTYIYNVVRVHKIEINCGADAKEIERKNFEEAAETFKEIAQKLGGGDDNGK